MSEVCVDPAGLLQRRLDTLVRLPPWHFVLAPRSKEPKLLAWSTPLLRNTSRKE